MRARADVRSRAVERASTVCASERSGPSAVRVKGRWESSGNTAIPPENERVLQELLDHLEAIGPNASMAYRGFGGRGIPFRALHAVGRVGAETVGVVVLRIGEPGREAYDVKFARRIPAKPGAPPPAAGDPGADAAASELRPACPACGAEALAPKGKREAVHRWMRPDGREAAALRGCLVVLACQECDLEFGPGVVVAPDGAGNGVTVEGPDVDAERRRPNQPARANAAKADGVRA